MPGIRLEEEPRRQVLVVETRDSAGRTEAQAAAMDNTPYDNPAGNGHCQLPPKLSKADATWAKETAIACSNYPRALYHRAVRYPLGKDGKPDLTGEPKYLGDVVNPNCPLPQNAAERIGARGDWERNGSETHLVQRHPYKTCMVPAGYQPEHLIDEEACEREEATLLAQGWKRSIDELGLPRTLSVEEMTH